MKHIFYEKIPYSADKWQFSESTDDLKKIDWCVTEKCHGANFSFLCDGHTVNYARRNSIIKEKEKFFGYKTMAQKYKDNVFNAFTFITNDQTLKNKYINNNHQISQISIYGEMFGGLFPTQQKPKNNTNNNTRRRRRRRRGNRRGKNKGNDKITTNNDTENQWITVGKKNETQQTQKQTLNNKNNDNEEKKNDNNYVVQREILYCPYIEFYAFDIAITLKPNNNKNEFVIRKYMDYVDSIDIFKFCKFFYAKPLYIGTFEDCCTYNYEFKSKIPHWLGLNPLHPQFGQNLAEGVIVKPMKNIFISNDEEDNTLRRAIVKLKHPLFQERIGDFKRKYNDNNDNKNKDKDLIHIESMMDMVNNNRYQSVISKYGNPEKDNHEFYVDKIISDIFDDMMYIEENEINEWWETKILKKPQLIKYIEMKLHKKAINIIFRNTKSDQND